MTQKPNNLRNVSLEVLRQMKDDASPLVFDSQIKDTLKGREMNNLKERFLSGRIADHSREMEYQDSLLDFLRKDIGDSSKVIKEKASDVAQKQEAAKQAYEEYLNAKTAWEKAKQDLAEAISAEEGARDALSSIESSYGIAERRLNDIDTLVLVHRSANIGQLMDHHLGKIIITEADARFLGNLIKPDAVFDSSLATGLMGSMPYQFHDLHDDEKRSIIQFVEMAMYYYLTQEKPVVVLYANSGLATILKKEGI